MSETWDGLLPIDKPAGPTSHDLVAWVRRATGTRRVGHTGTLDPPATGLLLLVLGRATRLARFIPDAPKTYRGVFALGLTTATDDLAGAVMTRHDGPLPDWDAVRGAAAALLGRQLQVPPAFSARSVGGTRLYRAARRGIRLEAPASPVVVDAFHITPTDAPDRVTYEMIVSSGTYVRAIVRDLGAALGCGAAVASLRRTEIGPLRVEDALEMPVESPLSGEVARRHVIPIDAMPLSLPALVLEDGTEAKRFAAGVILPIGDVDLPECALAAVRDGGGRLVGIGEYREGTLRPRVVVPIET